MAQNFFQQPGPRFNPLAANGATALIPPLASQINANRMAAFSNNPYAGVSTVLPATAFGTAASNNPYGTNSGYGESPAAGYMRGYAGIVNSVTKGMTNEQQSLMMRQRVQRERGENRRRAFDNWLDYRENRPTVEDDRQADAALQLRQALNDPPAGEIYSGRAMNVLLDDLGRKLGKGSAAQGPQLALNVDVLSHLNFTGQQTKGSPGLLKFVSTDDGRLPWPVVFNSPQYKADRELLDRLIRSAYKDAEGGRVDSGNLESMNNAVRKLERSLTDNIRDLTPNQYGEARVGSPGTELEFAL